MTSADRAAPFARSAGRDGEFDFVTETKVRKVVFTAAEEREMLDWCVANNQPRLRDFIVIALSIGFRRGELLGLDENDLIETGEDGYLDLIAEDTKNGDPRTLEVSGEAVEAARR